MKFHNKFSCYNWSETFKIWQNMSVKWNLCIWKSWASLRDLFANIIPVNASLMKCLIRLQWLSVVQNKFRSLCVRSFEFFWSLRRPTGSSLSLGILVVGHNTCIAWGVCPALSDDALTIMMNLSLSL